MAAVPVPEFDGPAAEIAAAGTRRYLARCRRALDARPREALLAELVSASDLPKLVALLERTSR